MRPTTTNAYLAPEAEISLNVACLCGTPPWVCLDGKNGVKKVL
jgi:hypothetical protein